jgi:hypothetical protein
VVAAKHDAVQAGTSTRAIFRKYLTPPELAAAEKLAGELEKTAFPPAEKPAR